MALKNSFYSCSGLEGVDVLSVVLFIVVVDRERVGRSNGHSI